MTGIIFGAIAAAWLVYLVPYFLRRRNLPDDDVDAETVLSSADVTIVRNGADLSSSDADVSTPATREARLGELHQLEVRAARRRARVLIVLAVVQVAAVVSVVLGFGHWWDAAIPAVLIVAFLVVARFSVRAMRRDLAARAQRIQASGDEPTVVIQVGEQDAAEHGVELSGPIGVPSSLWDPIPITRPTYVSTPLAPRTVRTIDLAPPRTSVPVLADILEQLDAQEAEEQRRRNVG